MKTISPAHLLLLGVSGLVLFVLIPTISRALGISDTGAVANVVFLIQAAAGFGGLIAIVLGGRGLLRRRGQAEGSAELR